MRISRKGQVTIPKHLREAAGLMPGAFVSFLWDGKMVRIVPVAAKARHQRGAGVVGRLRGSASLPMTTDEILALTRGTD